MQATGPITFNSIFNKHRLYWTYTATTNEQYNKHHNAKKTSKHSFTQIIRTSTFQQETVKKSCKKRFGK